MLKKSFLVVFSVFLLIFVFHSLFISESKAVEDNDQSALTILTPHSSPKLGNIWTVSFQTKGTGDISIIPSDENTVKDLEFVGLYCDNQKIEHISLSNNIIFVKGWYCAGTAQIKNKILKQGEHTLKFQFNEQTEYAYNSVPAFKWAKRLGGVASASGYGVTTDSNNNIIVTGVVVGNADVNGDGDSTDGGAEDATNYGSNDIIISVFDSSGIWQWAKRLGGIDSDGGWSVITDSDDNIIVTGSVTGDADLNGDGNNTGGGAEDATNYGSNDIFVSVFDSSGTWQWAKRLGGLGNDLGYGVTVDSDDNIIVTGAVTGDADVNGDGNCTGGGAEDASNYGSRDVLISVFDSSGTWQWAKRLGGTGADDGFSVITDSDDNIIVTGAVIGDVDVNGDGDSTDDGAEDANNYGDYDIFISVFDSSGTWQWAKRLGGTSYDRGYGVDVDDNDNVVISGYVRGAADINGDGDRIDGGTMESSGLGGTDIFISVFDSSGTWQWGKRLGGPSGDEARGVTVDANNNVIVVGRVNGYVDLNGDGDNTDGGAEDGDDYLYYDIFISAFNSFGTWQWAIRLGGTDYDGGWSVITDSDDSIIVTGFVAGDADFNGDGDSTDGGAEDVTDGGDDIIISVFSFDENPPEPSSFSPSSGANITDSTPTITFTLDEAGDCRASLDDESYTDMSDDIDCAGDGTTNILCTMNDLGVDGSKPVYISCNDSSGNGDTADTNEALNYTLDTTAPYFYNPNQALVFTKKITEMISFGETMDVTTDSAGNIYVVEVHDGVYKYDSNYNYLGRIDADFTTPTSAEFDSVGNLYVLYTDSGVIQKFDVNGDSIKSWGSRGNDDGLLRPGYGGITVDLDDNIYVADSSNNRIQKFNSDGVFLRKWGSAGSGNGQFSSIKHIAVDSDNNIYVSDSGNDRIQKFDLDGNYLSQFGSSGTGDGQFGSLWGLTIDSQDNIYVGDSSLNRVQKFDSTGNFLSQWAESGSEDGKFIQMAGLHVGALGKVYITDYIPCRGMQIFQPQGLVINNDTEYASSSAVILSLGASDNYTATTSLEMIISENSDFNSASWEAYSEDKNFILSAGEGEKIIYVKYQDSSFNVSAIASSSIIFDTAGPSIDVGVDVYTKISKEINATTSDLTSGIASYLWSKTSGAGDIYFSATSSEDTSVTATTDGTYTIRLTATDNVDNLAYDDFDLVWDTVLPTVSAGVDKEINTQFTQIGTASDAGSGISSYSWTKVSGPGIVIFGSGSAVSTSVSVDTSGTYVLRLTVADNAGNTKSDDMTLVWAFSSSGTFSPAPAPTTNQTYNTAIEELIVEEIKKEEVIQDDLDKIQSELSKPTEQVNAVFETEESLASNSQDKKGLKDNLTNQKVAQFVGLEAVLNNLGIKRNEKQEQFCKEKIIPKVVDKDAPINEFEKNVIDYFVSYGTRSTRQLGAGERAGVINSFQSAFGRLPDEQSEWDDIIKVANGRWPVERNVEAEKRAEELFEKIYLRPADRTHQYDEAAVAIIAYGLRPAQRNMKSENTARKIFEDIFKHAPLNATDWDMVRAIAYSGATREGKYLKIKKEQLSKSEEVAK